MQLTTTNRSALVPTPSDPRCAAIMRRHGDFPTFNRRWCPANLPHIAENVSRSVSEGVPSLVMLMRTYGKEPIQDNLSLHLGAMVAAMNLTAEVDLRDLDTIARLITESEPLRTLNYAYLLTFFAKVEQGEYKIYSAKPHQVMAALQEYAKVAHMKQGQDVEAYEKELERAEAARRKPITFEEWASLRGINETNPLEILTPKK